MSVLWPGAGRGIGRGIGRLRGRGRGRGSRGGSPRKRAARAQLWQLEGAAVANQARMFRTLLTKSRRRLNKLSSDARWKASNMPEVSLKMAANRGQVALVEEVSDIIQSVALEIVWDEIGAD